LHQLQELLQQLPPLLPLLLLRPLLCLLQTPCCPQWQQHQQQRLQLGLTRAVCRQLLLLLVQQRSPTPHAPLWQLQQQLLQQEVQVSLLLLCLTGRLCQAKSSTCMCVRQQSPAAARTLLWLTAGASMPALLCLRVPMQWRTATGALTASSQRSSSGHTRHMVLMLSKPQQQQE
jgi:hypothetical protein